MPSAYPLLPADPPVPYTKPTLENTHGGKTYTPTHPELFKVDFTSSIDGQEGFSSRLVAEQVSLGVEIMPCAVDWDADAQDFFSGQKFCSLDNVSLAEAKAYSSVQFGTEQHDHLELNSDLLFSESSHIQ